MKPGQTCCYIGTFRCLPRHTTRRESPRALLRPWSERWPFERTLATGTAYEWPAAWPSAGSSP